MGLEVRKGGCEKGKERETACAFKNTAPLSLQPTQRQRRWLMQEIVDIHVHGQKQKMPPNKIRKKRAREEADLTSWPQPSHMMGFENEPIIVSDADEFGQSCWCCCGPFNTYHIRTTTGLFLIKNKKKHLKKVKYILNGTALQEADVGAPEGQL